VWCGSGRRASTHTRLDAQSANPHLGRLSLSGDALHHVIRWNVVDLTMALFAKFWVNGNQDELLSLLG
jgi:hypothetical protein